MSGSFLTAPLYAPGWPYIPTFQILNAMGTRMQYDGDGNLVSSSNIVGVAPLNSTASHNDNLVQTQWPVLTSFGVAFLLDANVTLLGVAGGYNTSISAISGEPPVEYPIAVSTTTFSYGLHALTRHVSDGPDPRSDLFSACTSDGSLSLVRCVRYFMYQSGNTATALECPAPPPLQLVYYYTASDKHTQDSYSFGLGKSVWSSCGTGVISLQGPYSFPSQYSLAGRTVYIAQGIVGERVFVNTSYAQRVNVSGVTTQDGGDYVLYLDSPFVDYAGITMATDVEPAFPTGSFPGYSYINWWTPEGTTMYEAISPVTADNVMQFTTTPYVQGQKLPSCDLSLQSTVFYYCYYADMGDYEVRMTGSVVTNALNTTDGSYWVTGMDGLRVEYNASSGLNTSSSAYDMVFQQDADGNHNNRLFQKQPFLDSNLGVTFNLNADASNGGGRTTRLSGSPPQESWGLTVNDTLHAAQSPFQSYFLYQNASAPACPLRHERAPLLKEWAFRYTVTTPSEAWLITCTGTLTVMGPYQQSLAPSQVVYVVVNATGERAYITSSGTQELRAIVGLANATLAGASQLLYDVKGDDFALDTAGLALLLDANASWPGLPSSSIVLLTGPTTMRERPYYPGSTGAGLDATLGSGASTTEVEVEPENPVWEGSPAFELNGNEVDVGYHAQGMWAVAILVLALAMHAVFALQRVALQLQSRVAVSHTRLVTSLIGVMSGVYGVCGVWAAEVMLVATLQLDCPGCVYEYSLSLMQSRVALALLPATLLALPSWALLCNTAVIVRIREASRSSQVRGVEGISSRMGSLLTTAMHSRSTGSVGGKSPRSSLSSRAKDAVLGVGASALSMLQSLRPNLGRMTLVIALPIAAGIILTRVTLATGLVAPVDLAPSIVANVLGACLTCVLCWLMVAAHLSGRVWRYWASVGLPLVVLLDFHVDAASRSVTWNGASSSLGAASLDDTALYTIGGCLGIVSALVYALSLVEAVHRRRRLLERQVHQAENKFQSTQKKLDAQRLLLRRLRTLHDESVRLHDIVALARPGSARGCCGTACCSRSRRCSSWSRAPPRCRRVWRAVRGCDHPVRCCRRWPCAPQAWRSNRQPTTPTWRWRSACWRPVG